MLKLYAALTSRLELLRDRDDGQAVIEYVLIAALISVVAILAMQAVGQDVTDTFNDVANAIV